MITYSETQDGKEIMSLIKMCKSPKGLKTVDIAASLNIKTQRASYLLNKLSRENKVIRIKVFGEEGIRWVAKKRDKIKPERLSPIQEFDNCLRHLR